MSTLERVQFLMDYFHIWHKWSLAWDGVPHKMMFDLWPIHKSSRSISCDFAIKLLKYGISCHVLYNTYSFGWILSVFFSNGILGNRWYTQNGGHSRPIKFELTLDIPYITFWGRQVVCWAGKVRKGITAFSLFISCIGVNFDFISFPDLYTKWKKYYSIIPVVFIEVGVGLNPRTILQMAHELKLLTSKNLNLI